MSLYLCIDLGIAGAAATCGTFWMLRRKWRDRRKPQPEVMYLETPEQTVIRHVDEEARRAEEAMFRAAVKEWPR